MTKPLKTTEDVKELIRQAMVNLTINTQLFAMIAAKVGVEVVENKIDNHLAWTNGHGIYINATRILKDAEEGNFITPNNKTINLTLKRDNLIFLIAHEVGHIVCKHFERAKQLGISFRDTSAENRRKFELWNIAADHEINLILKYNEKEGKKSPIGEILETALCDDKYRNMPAEKIYRQLLEEEKEHPNNKQNQFAITLTNEKTGETKQVDASGLLQELNDITLDQFKQIVSEAFGNRNQGTGDLNSAFDRFFDLGQIIKPFNWKKALTKYIRGWMKNNYTWNIPSRAGLASGLTLPSAGKTPKLHLAVAVDTSGSISNKELNAMLRHLFIILNQFKEFTIDVWCCGTRVFEETFTTFTNKNKNNLKNYKIISDGCNDMEKNFAFIEKKYTNNKPDVFICMSDFYDKLNGNKGVRYNGDCIFMVIDHPDFVPPKHIKAEVIPFEIPDGK